MAVAQPTDYSEQMLVCIQNCQDCHRACLQTLAYCLRQGGRHAEPDHLRLLMDCTEICQTSAAFMIRGSDLHAHTCAACAEVCQRCADDCRTMASDVRMKALADTCQHCADSCRAMAAGPAQGPSGAHGATVSGDGAVGTNRAAAGAARPGTATSARGARRAGPVPAPVLTRRKTK